MQFSYFEIKLAQLVQTVKIQYFNEEASMKNLVYFMMVSLLILGGCNQSLDSLERKTGATQKVRINLESGNADRSNRYRGSFDDVVNGGSVRLYYALDNTSEQMTQMNYDGSSWSVNLSMSIGTYRFRAEAFNHNDIMIFDTVTPRDYEITADTTSLNLGLQLNPIPLDTGNTPMPVITQIIKPSGYTQGEDLRIQFTAIAGATDSLEFRLAVSNADGEVGSKQENYSDIGRTEANGIATYNDDIAVWIPHGTTGNLTVQFSVESLTLQAVIQAQFELIEEQNNIVQDLFFMPVVDSYSLGAKENDANALAFYFNVASIEGFDSAVQFCDDSMGNCTDLPDIGETPTECYNNYNSWSNNCVQISGELTRPDLEPGKLQITFTSDSDQSITSSYEIDVPAGQLTDFVTDNIASYVSREPAFVITDAGKTVNLYDYSGHLNLYPDPGTTSYNINAKGTSRIEITSQNYYNSEDAWLGFTVSDVSGNTIYDSDSCCQHEIYLPQGQYTLTWRQIGGQIMNGITFWSYPVHVMKDDLQIVGIVGEGKIQKFPLTIGANQSKTYDFYKSPYIGPIAFVQDSTSENISLELTDSNGNPYIIDGVSLSGSGSLFIDDTVIPEGWYQLHINNGSEAEWSGVIAAYAGYSVPTNFTEANSFKGSDDNIPVYFIPPDYSPYYTLRNDSHSGSISYTLDTSYDCSRGKELTLVYNDTISVEVTNSSGSIGTAVGRGMLRLTPEECSNQNEMIVTNSGEQEFDLQIWLTPFEDNLVFDNVVLNEDFEDSPGTFSENLSLYDCEESSEFYVQNGTLTAFDNGCQADVNVTIEGAFMVEFDVKKEGPSNHGVWDFFVTINADQYYYSPRPTLLFDNEGDGSACLTFDQGGYECVSGSSKEGKLTIKFYSNKILMDFTDSMGVTIQREQMVADTLPFYKRISTSLAAYQDSPRSIDNLKITSTSAAPAAE